MNTFRACGPGAVIRYHGNSFIEQHRHWCEIRKWCEEQGWKLNEDHTIPPNFPTGKWYFNSIDKQILFILRWS